MRYPSSCHFEFTQADELSFISDGQACRDGYIHCKTVPFYIFAQAYEGHYELSAGTRSAGCEEGGAFFTPPDIPLAIRHRVNPRTGQMRIRFLHFRVADQFGCDPFAGREIPLAVSAADAVRPAAAIRDLLACPVGFRREALLWECIDALYQLTGEAPRSEIPEALRRVIGWIGENAGSPIDTGTILRRFSGSRSKFYREFTCHVGLPPGAYIQRERIRFASRLLLRRPELSIKEIAAACGWKTPYHFSRVFKAETGISPRACRLQAGKY